MKSGNRERKERHITAFMPEAAPDEDPAAALVAATEEDEWGVLPLAGCALIGPATVPEEFSVRPYLYPSFPLATASCSTTS
jgi:hypothetical protein